MVSWQTLVEIAFDVAEQKGAEFDGIQDGGAFMADLAEAWSQDKQKWKQYTEQQARNRLMELVEA